MAVTSMSVKGQVVIPKEVREAMALQPGARLIVEAEGDRIVLRPARRQAGTRLYGRYRGVDLLSELRKERRKEAVREGRLHGHTARP